MTPDQQKAFEDKLVAEIKKSGATTDVQRTMTRISTRVFDLIKDQPNVSYTIQGKDGLMVDIIGNDDTRYRLDFFDDIIEVRAGIIGDHYLRDSTKVDQPEADVLQVVDKVCKPSDHDVLSFLDNISIREIEFPAANQPERDSMQLALRATNELLVEKKLKLVNFAKQLYGWHVKVAGQDPSILDERVVKMDLEAYRGPYADAMATGSHDTIKEALCTFIDSKIEKYKPKEPEPVDPNAPVKKGYTFGGIDGWELDSISPNGVATFKAPSISGASSDEDAALDDAEDEAHAAELAAHFNDTIYFGVMDARTAFGDDELTSVGFAPKAFWEENHYIPDWHILDTLNEKFDLVNIDLDEVCENNFVTSMSRDEIIKALTAAGLVFHEPLDDFLNPDRKENKKKITTDDCKAFLVTRYPDTKAKDWKRGKKFEATLGTVRVFTNKNFNLEVQVLEDLTGDLDILPTL